MNFITELDYKIGQNIKNIRIKLNLSSLHLGDYLNVSSSFIRSVENGKSKYNIRHIGLPPTKRGNPPLRNKYSKNS